MEKEEKWPGESSEESVEDNQEEGEEGVIGEIVFA